MTTVAAEETAGFVVAPDTGSSTLGVDNASSEKAAGKRGTLGGSNNLKNEVANAASSEADDDGNVVVVLFASTGSSVSIGRHLSSKDLALPVPNLWYGFFGFDVECSTCPRRHES